MTHRRLHFVLLIALMFALDAAWAESSAHVHGRATLKFALDGPQLTLSLESPLEALLGFERGPRNAAEREIVRRIGQDLRQADTLFTLSPAAQCRLEQVLLSSSALPAELLQEQQVAAGVKSQADASRGTRPVQRDAHGDLLAEYRYFCTRPERLRSLQTGAFKAFTKLHRIEVERVSSTGQGLHRLTYSQARISW